ncbi:MAG: rhomboid family intramembrane serine protease [Gemmatimonadota bacterium]|nr:rhomboid family intramembrane serine protease [Gemmatimonadota bacterium]
MAYRTGGYSFGGFMMTPMVKRLLIANVATFVVLLMLPERTWVLEWLAFRPDRVLTRPWGAITYMFVHADLIHLLVNMLVLFFFGPPLEDRWGSREFLRYYLICGMGGVLLSFLLAPGAPIVGASAACYGLMLAFAMSWPDAPIYVWGIFPVKAKYLVGFFFLLTFVQAFGAPGGPVAHMAHLGGLLTGLVYIRADWRPGARLESIKRRVSRIRRPAIVPRNKESQPRSSSWRANDEGELLDAVDRVLDKISTEGMSALTRDERKLLDEVSRRHRTHN